MSTFVVVNPTAGAGQTSRAWPAIARELDRRLGPFIHAETRFHGHAIELVRDAVLQGANSVIAVGGDGTINEAVNGLAAAGDAALARCSLGVLALGTGSDFVRNFPIGNLGTAIDRLTLHHHRKIDLGRVTYRDDGGRERTRYFVNIASFGISGAIDRAMNASNPARLLPRKISFLTATVGALLKYRFQAVRLTIDNLAPVEADIAVVAAANGRYFGGGMMIAPDAEPDDGSLNIITLRGTSKSVLLRDLRLVYGGKHRNHPAISMQCAQRLVAEAVNEARDGPVLLDIDGESPGKLPATFEILPGALTLRC